MMIQILKGSEYRGKATQLLAVSGLAAGLLASSCCLLPLILVSVGIGGAWISQLTALAPYQPIFLGVAAIALGLGFWRAYRRQNCAVGSLCEENLQIPRATKAVLWLGTGAVFAALGVNVIVPMLL